MNKQKLYNIIRKELDNRYSNTSAVIKKQKFSFKFLKSLFNDYELEEWTENSYCCYGEDICCWIDENTCWWPDSIKNNSIRQYRNIKNSINRILTPEQIKKWNIYKVEINNYIILWLPMRFTSTVDMALAFKRK